MKCKDRSGANSHEEDKENTSMYIIEKKHRQ
jgi:hypothetical protein